MRRQRQADAEAALLAACSHDALEHLEGPSRQFWRQARALVDHPVSDGRRLCIDIDLEPNRRILEGVFGRVVEKIGQRQGHQLRIHRHRLESLAPVNALKTAGRVELLLGMQRLQRGQVGRLVGEVRFEIGPGQIL